jgi:hypothetical protein
MVEFSERRNTSHEITSWTERRMNWMAMGSWVLWQMDRPADVAADCPLHTGDGCEVLFHPSHRHQTPCPVGNTAVDTRMLNLTENLQGSIQAEDVYNTVSSACWRKCNFHLRHSLTPGGNYMYLLLQQQETLHFIFMAFAWFTVHRDYFRKLN